MFRLRHARRSIYVLLHGAWHHGGLWEPVARRLRRHGHVVHTPTAAGHGPGADRNVSHADGVDSLVRYLDDHGLRDFVLVGHSLAGTFMCKLAELMPDRIRRLVFHNAFVPRDGHSLHDEIPPEFADLFRSLVKDGAVLVPFPIWREAFINDADEQLARAAYATLSPEPIGMLEDKLDLQRFYELVDQGQLRCSYVNATEDISLPHGEWAWHPRFSSRLGLCRLVQLSGSHEVMFTRPRRLAERLIEAGRD